MTNTIYGLFCCFGTFFLNFIVLFDLFKSLSLAKTRMVLKIIFSPLIFLVLILAFLAFLGLPLKKNFLSLMRLRMVLKTIFGKKLLFLILTLFGHFWPFWPFLAFCDFFAVIIIGYFSGLLSKKNSLIFMRLRMVLKIIFGKMPHLFGPFWAFLGFY